MDKVAKYKEIVREIAVAIGQLGDSPDSPIKNQIILDDEHGHYLLYFNGWKGENRTYGCYFHVDVSEDGKVWVQHDGTDCLVAQQFLDRGIPHDDIVLGFQAPIKRPDTGFALG
ncbi:XisI protein [Roseofilum casamattae]|uniref:XisI protein n=1 Tax=Roseofilum casamattae BLCC-M143 TaxID=3022442 RepID=A0ABT7BUJ7_9CYAN|nr:XisI protein [Roseofilum casamattae]MDJ1182452.1 XisI protein [Roseofilum casamattae BLCC-M143]